MNKNFKTLIFYVLMIITVVFAVWALQDMNQPAKMTYSGFVELIKQQKISQFDLDMGSGKVTYKLTNGNQSSYMLPDVNLFLYDVGDLLKEQRDSGKLIYDVKRPVDISGWVNTILTLLIIGLAIFFIYKYFYSQAMGGGKGAMSFGKARTKLASDEKKKVTFKDVAGVDEEKEELVEIVDFLKDPRKYVEMGARIPKGVLLVGPPGTGKTLLAKAVAGEAGVPFYSITGSDFVEMFVGVGASRVRDLFDQAKRSSPCIVFIDEIDAVGRYRGAGLGGGHDEREQTLNQLLVEMDGFSINEGVIVMAATNRADILDPALLRPGRFDRQVYVNIPDIKGREQILKVHARNKPIAPNVDFSRIAKGTVGFTGADLENLLNEASILAVKRGKKVVDIVDIEDSIMKVLMGPEKKSKIVTERERKLTSYHEAGHALVSKFLPTSDPVYEISIIPRGMSGGYTLHLPNEDKSYSTKMEMFEHIVSLLGGRVAEKLALDDISTGASNDIERASTTARNMVTKYGMSDKIGPIVFGTGHDEVFLGRDFAQQRNYSESVAAQIDEEVKNIIESAYKKAQDILEANIDKLHVIAKYLFENEKMSGEQFSKLFEGSAQA